MRKEILFSGCESYAHNSSGSVKVSLQTLKSTNVMMLMKLGILYFVINRPEIFNIAAVMVLTLLVQRYVYRVALSQQSYNALSLTGIAKVSSALRHHEFLKYSSVHTTGTWYDITNRNAKAFTRQCRTAK